MSDYAGNYMGDVVSIALTKSKKKGSPQVEIMFHIDEILDGGQYVPMTSPIERTMYMSLKGDAEPITFDVLDRVGFNGSFENPQVSFPRQELNCYEEEYNNKVSMKWRLAGGAPKNEPADMNTIKKAEARWKNAHQNRTAPGPTTVTSSIAKPSPQPAPFDPDDGSDDVPF